MRVSLFRTRASKMALPAAKMAGVSCVPTRAARKCVSSSAAAANAMQSNRAVWRSAFMGFPFARGLLQMFPCFSCLPATLAGPRLRRCQDAASLLLSRWVLVANFGVLEPRACGRSTVSTNEGRPLFGAFGLEHSGPAGRRAREGAWNRPDDRMDSPGERRSHGLREAGAG